MKLQRKGNSIYLSNENNNVIFTFGGNLDLYIVMSGKSGSDNTFTITKENYGVYHLFEELYNDIENINIFMENVPYYNEEYVKERKSKIRMNNLSSYNELFDKENKIIAWHSDETAYQVSNILKIKKEDETFKLEFLIQPYIHGYDEDFHSANYIPIRFRNTGSRYEPFNILFMKLFNNIGVLDDVSKYGHQIHMEEYLYEKDKVFKKNR